MSPLYINRILVYPKIGKCDVTFRKGLNVIISENIINDNKENSDVRNSTGKTTFVHLIDYVLGKEKFLNQHNNEAELLFKDRSVIAEVQIYNEKYTIKRSIINSDSIIIYSNWISEDLLTKKNNEVIYLDTDLNGYISFLEQKILKGKNYFEEKHLVTYRSIMNFIQRDQFYGFSKYNSGIKDERAAIANKRIEFLLGMLTPEKITLSMKIDTLKKEQKELTTKHNILKRYLSEVLEKSCKDIKNEVKNNKVTIFNLRSEYDKLNQELFNIEKKQFETKDKKESLEKQLEDVYNDMEVIKCRVSNYQSTLNETVNDIEKLKHIKISMNMLDGLDYKKCPVVMKKINKSNTDKSECPLVKGDLGEKNDKILQAKTKILLYEKDDLEKAIQCLKNRDDELEKEAQLLKQKIEEVTDLIDSTINESITKRDSIGNQINELEYQNRLYENQMEQYKYLSELGKNKAAKIKEVKNEQDKLDELNKGVDRFDEIYNEIIEFLSNNSRMGSINDKNFKPVVLFKNQQEDTGAGIRSIGIIAYDIAMLAYSLECRDKKNNIPYMDFLIHDSPKRNDIDLDMYKKVFDYIIKLEDMYETSDVDFQYIITTLDISSKVEANKDKYIRLTLDNSGEGGKLFGTTI